MQQTVDALVDLSRDSLDMISLALTEQLERLAKVRSRFHTGYSGWRGYRAEIWGRTAPHACRAAGSPGFRTVVGSMLGMHWGGDQAVGRAVVLVVCGDGWHRGVMLSTSRANDTRGTGCTRWCISMYTGSWRFSLAWEAPA